MEVALLSDVFRRSDAETALGAIAAAGFRHVELNASFNWDPHLNLESASWPAATAAIGQAARRLGLTVTAVACYPNLAATDPEERRRAVEYCRRGIEACRALGGTLITVMPGGNNLLPVGPQVAALRQALRLVCEAAAARGVGVAIESYPGNCIEGTEALLGLIREVASPALGYLLCTAHLAAGGEDLLQAYRVSRGLLRHVHLSDTRTVTPQHQHLVPGLGDVRFDGLLREMIADGYAGTLTLQIYSHAAEPEAASARALAAFRQFWPAGPGRGPARRPAAPRRPT